MEKVGSWYLRPLAATSSFRKKCGYYTVGGVGLWLVEGYHEVLPQLILVQKSEVVQSLVIWSQFDDCRSMEVSHWLRLELILIRSLAFRRRAQSLTRLYGIQISIRYQGSNIGIQSQNYWGVP